MKLRPLFSQEQALFPSFRNKYDFFDEVVVAKILKEHVPRVCVYTNTSCGTVWGSEASWKEVLALEGDFEEDTGPWLPTPDLSALWPAWDSSFLLHVLLSQCSVLPKAQSGWVLGSCTKTSDYAQRKLNNLITGLEAWLT